MPFALIETTNAKGKCKLSVVPNKWLRASPNGSVVLWPNGSPQEQETLLRSEHSCPSSSWLRYKCTVKRNLIGSYNQALKLLERMTDGDVDSNQIRHEKESQTFLQELVYKNTSRVNVAPPTGIRKANRNSFPVITSAYSAANTDNVRFVSDDDVHQVEAEDPIQKCLDKMDIIINMQQQINKRLDALEKRVTVISDQNTAIFQATVKQKTQSKTEIEETLSFNFTPMETEHELVDLEKKLEHKTFSEKLVKWLRVNVSGKCAEDRMLCVLDLMFTKKFQTMCTWTGVSRKGPKTAIMPNRNILEIFQILGSDDMEVVNQRELAAFFMKKLKNSLKRLTITGVRRSTRHVRRRKVELTKPEEIRADEGESSMSDAELEDGFTYMVEDLSDGQDSQEQTASVSDTPPTSDNNFDPYFIVKVEQ
ncbi:uncharacterized protein LOC134215454 [Armigeres subalbatus]|uniref:uncharacterized protein LOC134215454 n=1 Tax=Armigeres subalbatus TaxID=124917 RepID=UPI002ECFB60D